MTFATLQFYFDMRQLSRHRFYLICILDRPVLVLQEILLPADMTVWPFLESLVNLIELLLRHICLRYSLILGEPDS